MLQLYRLGSVVRRSKVDLLIQICDCCSHSIFLSLYFCCACQRCGLLDVAGDVKTFACRWFLKRERCSAFS